MTDHVSSVNSDDTSTVSSSSDSWQLVGNVTSDDGAGVGGSGALLPVEFVVVLVLAAACVVVGVVYAYIHITRAARARVEKRKRRPSSAAALHHGHHGRELSSDEGQRQTHLMFFRRTTSTMS